MTSYPKVATVMVKVVATCAAKGQLACGTAGRALKVIPKLQDG